MCVYGQGLCLAKERLIQLLKLGFFHTTSGMDMHVASVCALVCVLSSVFLLLADAFDLAYACCTTTQNQAF